MTARSTILIGLLLCAVLLAGTRITPAPTRGGACEEIEVTTGGVGRRQDHRVFARRAELHEWSVVEGRLVINRGDGRAEEFVLSTIENFECTLPNP